jgi:glycosyltransferase involved in cell wall biosynthesis
LGLMHPRSRDEQLRRALREYQPKTILIHYLTYAAEFESVLNTVSQRIFIHCHGYDVTWDLRKHYTPNQPCFEDTYLATAIRLSHKAVLIANSQHTKQRLRQIGISGDRIVVKHLGVPIPPLPRKRQVSNSIDILYLGRLIDCKGPDLTIAAFEMACDRGLDGNLIIAGDGEMRVTCELMKVRSRYSSRIHLIGAVDAAMGVRLRETADVFTTHHCVGPLSHQVEAFSVSLVEAMADSLPVIAGRIGGPTEIVVDGHTGYLVEPGNVHSQAEAFLSLASDPRRRLAMGEAGWQRAKDHFSIDKERSELLHILDLEPKSRATVQGCAQ